MIVNYCFGFTGTRHGMTAKQKDALGSFLSGSSGELHHGDCIGADAEAHDIAMDLGYCPVIHPPSDYSHRAWCVVPKHLMRDEKTHFARNRDIVDETTALIAAPAEAEEQQRGGTWYTVRYAKKRGKSVVVILPDGSIKQTSAA